jgi:DNA repair exonuclease SbcCD ATPase subunit
MSPHDNEPLTDIPRMVPERDDVVSYQRQKPQAAKPKAERSRAVEADDEYDEPAVGSGGKVIVYLLAVVTAGLLAWSGWQQQQLSDARVEMAASQARISDLEQRLSVTDESVNQSSVAIQVKLKDLDGEVRKLWDNVWKKNQEALAAHQAQLAALDKAVKAAQAELARVSQGLIAQQKSVDAMRGQLEQVAKTEATVELSKRKLDEQQVALESVTEKLNRITAEQNKLAQRIATNEEWVQSINNFRKQTNRELVNIKSMIAPVSGGTPQPLQ